MFVGVVLTIFGILVLVGFKFMSEFNDEIQSSSLIDSRGKSAVNSLEGTYPGVIDNSFLLLAIGLSLGALILASLVRISPIFLALYLIALVIIIFMCGIFSNIYQGVAENSLMTAQADQLLFISNLLEFLPLLVGVFGSILALIMYKSYRSE